MTHPEKPTLAELETKRQQLQLGLAKRWVYYNGGEYELLDIVHRAGAGTWMALYAPVVGPKVPFVRDLDDFLVKFDPVKVSTSH